MPPRPIVSLKILLMFKIVLFVFSDPLFVTSYTCNITSVILPLFLTNPIQSKNPDPTFTKITHRKALCHSLSLDLTLCLVQLLLFNFVPPSLFLAVCMRNSEFLDFGLEVLKNCFFLFEER